MLKFQVIFIFATIVAIAAAASDYANVQEGRFMEENKLYLV